MLTTPALAFVAVLSGAAAAELPITGAFGLEFGVAVPPARLGASIAVPPYPEPPSNLEQTVPAAPADPPGGWFLFRPQARPELLSDPAVRFLVLRDHAGFPVRILADHPNPDCADDVLWLTRNLGRKYQADADPFGAERAGFRHSARFESPVGQIDVSCGDRLLVEYTDPDRYRGWLAQRTRRLEAESRAAEALADQATLLERARQRRFADEITGGDRFRLQGVFGIPFGEPVDPAWLGVAEPPADEPVTALPPVVPPALRGGQFTITVGPDLMPVRIAGEFEDADTTLLARFAGALREKYGPPLKDTPHHKIHKVNGDYLIARYVPDQAMARVVFIDDQGRAAQQARQEAARAARLAEQERVFEEETAGL